ncbi:MAG: adenylosuccinate lyase [Candidatus Thermoplasmatota archaeon]|nr:adenylosuccinate lyase [Candidatus Thermoplasmatota archaeon]
MVPVEISPIDYRYGRMEVKSIFSQENRLKMMLLVEHAVLEAKAEFGLVPKKVPDDLKQLIASSASMIGEINNEERKTKHDVMAIINVINRHSKGLGEYLHAGMTSNDVNDTATALQLKSFLLLYIGSLGSLLLHISKIVKEHSSSLMVGRTHGQHASPITLGLKMAVFLGELDRHAERLIQIYPRILVGKIRGPVGTGAGLGPRALDIEDQSLNILGLKVEENSTQLIGRDRYIEFLSLLVNISATIERLATEIRNLQRPEIAEIGEGFDKKNQVGSSAMPSKMNPITSENICSLARLIRGYLTPEIEGSILWHERDLTNSALERFTIPYACILSDYIAVELSEVMENLWIDNERMLQNIKNDPKCMSESLVYALTQKGTARSEAHEMVRKASMSSLTSEDFRKNILKAVQDILTIKEVDSSLNPKNFIGASEEICKRTVKRNSRIMRDLDKMREVLVS